MKGLRIAAIFLSVAIGLMANATSGQWSKSLSLQSQAYQSDSNSSEDCLDHGKVLDVMNDQALAWKQSQSSGFKTRALVSGTVDEVFPDQTGHRHFSIRIGVNPDDHIEVIYNQSFGAMPLPSSGEQVEACGDYIVATQENGGYPPSPDGALIHWVHKNPKGRGHDSGFVMLNGVVYGNENGTGD